MIPVRIVRSWLMAQNVRKDDKLVVLLSRCLVILLSYYLIYQRMDAKELHP